MKTPDSCVISTIWPVQNWRLFRTMVSFLKILQYFIYYSTRDLPVLGRNRVGEDFFLNESFFCRDSKFKFLVLMGF
jgi:hypothetical protein